MPFISGVLLTEGLFPFLEIHYREEGIGILRLVVYDGKVEPVGQGQGLTIDISSAYDEHFLFVPA